jgi:hypothetical protein
MTIEQVRAVPGIAWSETKTEEIGAMKFTWLEATAPVKFGARAYSLRIDFTPDIGLSRIGFEDKTAVPSTKPTAACERRFTDALGELERRHGAFAARAKVGKSDTSIGTVDVAWRNAPTGKSTYEYALYSAQFDADSPVQRTIELSVARRFGNKLIGLREHLPDGETHCEITINYSDTSP